MNFEEIVEAHYASLHRFAVSLTRREHDAWDLTQQTFYLWAKEGHRLRDRAKTKAWLFTTLHRQFLQMRRHETRFPHFEVGGMDEELPAIAPGVVALMDAATVLAALHRLEEVYRAPLALFYLEDLSYKEISDVLEIPAGTVMSRLSRGKEQLRRALAACATAANRKILPIRSEPPFHEDRHG